MIDKLTIALCGKYEDHEKNWDSAYLDFSQKFPNSFIFPVFIGRYEEGKYSFDSWDINPLFLHTIFSNFNNPVLFIDINCRPVCGTLSKSLIKGSINIMYRRKYIYSSKNKTLSYLTNRNKIDVAIIDPNKKFEVSDLPLNILYNDSLKKIKEIDLSKSSARNFEIKRAVDSLVDKGFYFYKN